MNNVSITVGNFRLMNKLRFGDENIERVDIKEGIALETSNGKSWYVIAFVRWGDDGVYYECVGTRLTDNVDASEWPIVKELLECGAKIVEAANIEVIDD